MCLCYKQYKLVLAKAGEVNRQLRDTLAPHLWSCSFGWFLAEGFQSEISTTPMGFGPWTTLLYLPESITLYMPTKESTSYTEI